MPDSTAHDAETLAEVLTDYQLFEAVALWLCESFEDEDGIGCEPESGPPCLGHVMEASARVSATFAARIVQARAGEGALRERIEAAASCPHGQRHYYGIDAICRKCEMPSWVEALFRAALTDTAGDPT